MFPAEASSGGFVCMMPHLCVYSANEIDIFNVNSSEWVQTVNLNKVPFKHINNFVNCFISDFDLSLKFFAALNKFLQVLHLVKTENIRLRVIICIF